MNPDGTHGPEHVTDEGIELQPNYDRETAIIMGGHAARVYIEQLEYALREMLGSYESLARSAEAGHVISATQAMRWDGPICARRVLQPKERDDAEG